MGTDVQQELQRLRDMIASLEKRVGELENDLRYHEKQHERAEYSRSMEGF